MKILETDNNPKKSKMNEDIITARELLLFLIKDKNWSKPRFDRFCLKYADRDLTTIIHYLKRYNDNKITPKVAAIFKYEILKEAQQIQSQRKAARAKENIWDAFEISDDLCGQNS